MHTFVKGVFSFMNDLLKGTFFKTRMKELGFNQTSLREQSGVSQTTISRVMRGEGHNITCENLEKLLNTLELPSIGILIDPAVREIIPKLAHCSKLQQTAISKIINTLQEVFPTD